MFIGLRGVRNVYNLETFLVALVFCAVYTVAGQLHVLEMQFPRRQLSFAAGVSVAYVFVDILPELGERYRGFVEASGQELLFAEQRIYLAALLGFLFFYSSEHLVVASRVHDAPQDRTETNRLAFLLHIGGYALYSWLIGYLLMNRAIRGWLSLGLNAAAMSLQCAVVGNDLVREHGHAFRRRGRWLLAVSVLAGWVTSAMVPVTEVVVSRLFAFVAGGVVMTSMNEELPREREGLFWWFVLGTTGYAIVLLMA